MPNNKKHHYVPRFYLKNFSQDNRRISLFNISREQKILNSSLKNQCYEDYFYGNEPDVEDALSIIESEVANIFNQFEQTCRLPHHGSPDYQTLVRFIVIQFGRTKFLADSMEEMFGKFMKKLIEIDEPTIKEEDLSRAKIKIGNLPKLLVELSEENFPILLDLQCKLLKNCTNEGFVTSDTPVVLYNQLLAFRHGCCTGFKEKGLKIFFPINPKHLMLLYDHEVYRVGCEKKGVIELTNLRDIYELNKLHILSCHENIYFRDQNFNCQGLFKKAKPFLRKNNDKISSFPQLESDYNKNLMLTTYREDVNVDLKLSFLSIRRSAKQWRKNFIKKRIQPVMIPRKRS